MSASAAARPAEAFVAALRRPPRKTGTIVVVRAAARRIDWVADDAPAGTGSVANPPAWAPPRSAGASDPLAVASLVPTTVNLPSASAATNKITTPRPVKRPACSSVARVAPPTGVPALGTLVQAALIR